MAFPGDRRALRTLISGAVCNDVGKGIAVDPAGNAYVVGTTASGDFPTTNGAFQTGYAGGNSDAFILGYTANGQFLMFSTLLGSHVTDEGNGIALDSIGKVFVIGDANSDRYPVTPYAIQPNRGGGSDVGFFDGSGDDVGLGIAVDANSDAYFTGVASSGDFPVTVGAAQTQPGGGHSDAFFALITPANPALANDHFRGLVQFADKLM